MKKVYKANMDFMKRCSTKASVAPCDWFHIVCNKIEIAYFWSITPYDLDDILCKPSNAWWRKPGMVMTDDLTDNEVHERCISLAEIP